MAEVKTSHQKEKAPKKKHRLLRWLLLYPFLSFLIIFTAAFGFMGWAFQSESGHAWLLKTINSALEPAPDAKGIYFRLTSISGSLPFNFEAGLEGYDVDGLWLSVPQTSFNLDWRELPKTLLIRALRIENPDLSRLPHIEETQTAPEEPDKPFTLAELQAFIKEIGDFLNQQHWWMPNIQIEGVGLENALLPQGLPAQISPTRLRVDMDFNAAFITNNLVSNLNVRARNEDGTPFNIGEVEFKNADLKVEINGSPVANGLDLALGIDANIHDPLLHINDFPEDFLGKNINFNMLINAASGPDNAMSVKMDGPRLDAGNTHLLVNGAWKSGPSWAKGGVDGPLDFKISLLVNPGDRENASGPFAMLKSPLDANINISGDLPKVALAISVNCAKLVYEKQALDNLSLNLDSREIDLPLDEQAVEALMGENQIKMALKAGFEKQPIDIETEIFFQALKNQADTEKAWRFGLRNLSIDALGAKGAGQLAALLIPENKPALDGELRLEIAQWSAISRFLPEYKLSGNVKTDIKLVSGISNNPSEVEKLPVPDQKSMAQIEQEADINLEIPEFNMRTESGGAPVNINNLKLAANLHDPLGDLSFKTELEVGRLNVAGMNFDAKARVNGTLKGPIEANLSANGNVKAKIDAKWQPGQVFLNKLDAEINSATFIKDEGKGGILGAHLSAPAKITYGDNGIGVGNLDLRLLPSGRLNAAGSLSAEKLDFKLGLENINFKLWQSIIPQIPTGSANLRAQLTGTPEKPSGSFVLGLKNVAVPGAVLAPVSLALTGNIQNSGSASSLNIKLNIDPKTLKALGGDTSQITARIPLVFGEGGIPKPNMAGQLSASMRWNGALGPIWKLVPIADQRLNGRVAVNINASGSLEKPLITGGVNVEKARYENVAVGVLLTDINMKVNLSDKRAVHSGGMPGEAVLTLSLSDGRGGKVTVNGKAGLDGSDLDIKTKIDRLKPLRRRDVHVELSGNASVTGSATAPDISGEIIVNRGEVLLNNIAFTSSVTTLNITTPEELKKEKEKAPKNPETAQGSGKLNVRIIVPPRFTVEGRGLGSIWQANLLIGGTPENPKITGSVNSVSGNFDFLGKNFALTRGIVTFAGGSLANPLLNIELTNETPDLTAHIIITGPVNKMRLVLTSDPTLPRDDILSRVLFGKSINDLSRMEALQLAGAVAQLAGFGSGGGGVLDFAKKTLGVDVLRIGTSSSDAAGEGDEGAGGTTVEMGKYIGDKIYMGIQQGFQSDSTAFIIQLELTPRTSLEVRSEHNNTWGGLNWKYNY